MRGRRFAVILVSAGVLAVGCGTKAQPDNLAAAVTRTAGQTAKISMTMTMTMTMTTQMQSMSLSYTANGGVRLRALPRHG